MLRQTHQDSATAQNRHALELALTTEYARDIFDSQSAMLMITDGQVVEDANRPFLEFFDSLDVFAKGGLQRFWDRLRWEDPCSDPLSRLLTLEAQPFRVTLDHEGRVRHYLIRGRLLSPPEAGRSILISIGDVTELETMRQEQIKNAGLSYIGKLASGLTHEINTPLTIAKGSMEMLALEVDDPKSADRQEVQTYLEEVNSGLNRIAAIIAAVKEVAGVEKFEQESVNLYTTIIQVLHMLHHRFRHICRVYVNGTLFTPEMDEELEKVILSCTKQQMEQVWAIVFGNAVDAFIATNRENDFDRNQIDITITQQERIIITVQDNAGGIKPEVLAHLFEPFTTSKTHEGIGIGLSVARSIIAQHQGEISAENREGGACLTIRL